MGSKAKKDEIVELEHKINVLLSKLGRFGNYLANPSNIKNFEQIKLRLKSTQEDQVKYDEYQTRLEFLDRSKVYTREEHEDAFFQVMSEAEKMSKKEYDPTAQQTKTQTQQVSIPQPASFVPNIVQLGLPSFYGHYESWFSFWDVYKAMIHNRNDYPDSLKLLYLKSICKGDAAKIIDNLQSTDENYEIAIKLLRERYEHRRVIVNQHINTILFKLPDVTRENAKALRNLVDIVTQQINALEKLNMPVKQWDALLIPLIIKKLDDRTRREWESKLDGDNFPTLEEFLKFLNRKCFTLETLYTDNNITKNQSNSQTVQNSNPSYTYNKIQKGMSQLPNLQCFASSENVVCDICNARHFIYQCSKFLEMSISQRYEELRKHKLCTNCLRPGHFKFQCNSSNCRKCNLRHSTFLHEDNFKGKNQRVQVNDGQYSNTARNQGQQITNISATHCVTEISTPNSTDSSDPPNQSLNTPTMFAPDQVTYKNDEYFSGINAEQDFQNKTFVGNSCYGVSSANMDGNQVLLSTATILIADFEGRMHECTALLDSASQSNIITKKLCNKLKIKLQDYKVPICGINQCSTNVNYRVDVEIRSRFSDFSANLQCLVLPVITERLPLLGFSKESLNYPKNVQLADDKFNYPKEIDLLIGASIFYEILKTEKIYLGKNFPVMQNTVFGYILTGSMPGGRRNQGQKTICNFVQRNELDTLNDTLTRFWLIEELPQKQILSKEEEYCEEFFKKTTYRNNEGRFVVKLPFCQDYEKKLGESKDLCLKRFLNIESRLQRDERLKTQYVDFMKEYEFLSHMTLKCNFVDDTSKENLSYFIPHHPVLRESSLTTQCRVVYDASFKSSTQVSLNDLLCLGPTVQDDLFSIILRFRLNSVVLNADIKAMYRQILVDPSDRQYQQIVWRHDKGEPIQVYVLNTVTYGTKSAPYLATRCLKQLASENQEIYPRTSKIIESSFYMDDLILSVNSTHEAIEIYQEITKILSSAGLELRKWSSNQKSILNYISENDKSNNEKLVLPYENKILKTLGISWNPNFDTLRYSIEFETKFSQVTKRSILSILSQIYDPLGLIGPAIIKGKILIQELWKQKLNWDQPVPAMLKDYWIKFLSQIPILNDIQIRRQVLLNSFVSVEIFGFSDASIRAYGCSVYLCSVDNKGVKVCRLLCAKSKVAPLKKVTLPRLELLAAVLLAKLVHVVRETLKINIKRTTYFSDSTIVLSWLQIDPSSLKTFVGNRVAKILELTNIDEWTHVKSENNAADIISRGIDPEELLKADIWWYGPSFLTENITVIDNCELLPADELPEVKDVNITLVVSHKLNFEIFDRYSTLYRLQRVNGYLLRFKNRLYHKIKPSSESLTLEEFSESLNVLIRLSQLQEFCKEISCLQNDKPLEKDSKLLCLNPFLDHNGILRVTGRIHKSNDVDYNQKHPVILPYKHKLTYLIIRAEHLKNLHVGTQNLLAILRLNYWPINGKIMIKQILNSCVTCFRVKPKAAKFLMGQLPSARCSQNRVFSRCGVDYAGPVYVKDGVRRKSQVVKTYLCIFVCLAVKAVHIELVNDLTTASFLNALKRFISRRGKPSDIFSDNGSNFVGANNHFIELYNLISDKGHNEAVSEFLAKDKIRWHFIAANSPHLGGIWEAAVKSTKYHLRRVLGNNEASLHYEEMSTLLAQIEACLNSRPLTPISNDPKDYLPLTPAHFLIGDSLLSIPQLDVENTPINRLTRYHHLQRLVQSFWSRWSHDYLCQLQARSKWKLNLPCPVKIGSLIVMVEDGVPPLRWPMARVVELHPGADSVVRVVSVRVANGSVFKRSLAKICVLPVDEDLN